MYVQPSTVYEMHISVRVCAVYAMHVSMLACQVYMYIYAVPVSDACICSICNMLVFAVRMGSACTQSRHRADHTADHRADTEQTTLQNTEQILHVL